jgi:hypothetical protein
LKGSGFEVSTVIDQYQQLIKTKKLPEELSRRGYIQTLAFGYETPNVEKNAINAVYRAIDQSLRARNLISYTEIMEVLKNRPPFSSSIDKGYNLQVGIEENPKIKINYEIAIFELKTIQTSECPASVYARIATRIEDESFQSKLQLNLSNIRYLESLEDGHRILQDIENDRIQEVLKRFHPKARGTGQRRPLVLENLLFGDMFSLLSEKNPEQSYDAIYLGKGIFVFPFGSKHNATQVCKFGEEQLYGLRVDTNSFWRPKEIFMDEKYAAPESYLICLFNKFLFRKNRGLSLFSTFQNI